ncbi:MAG: hypothetical protein ABIO72_04495 [Patescibacteria group bacterium]
MHAVSLLFDRHHVFLGEIMSRDGGLERVLLNAEGERQVGPYMSDWQTRGVPIVREVIQATQGDTLEVFFQERVPVRSHEFWTALDRWSERHGMVLLRIPAECMRAWEGLLRLPLTDVERFSMTVALRASDNDHAAWHEAVAEAVGALETKDPSLKKKLIELKKMMTGGLMKKLQEA